MGRSSTPTPRPQADVPIPVDHFWVVVLQMTDGTQRESVPLPNPECAEIVARDSVADGDVVSCHVEFRMREDIPW